MPVSVIGSDANWPRRFRQERVQLERMLAPRLSDGVHHVGKRAFVTAVLARAGITLAPRSGGPHAMTEPEISD